MNPDIAILVTNAFKRQYKALKKTFKRQYKALKKTYRKIDQDFKSLLEILQKNPKSGKFLGHGLYKIRLEGKDIPGGKRGGYRIITCFIVKDNSIYLLSIYSKRQIENIPISKIKQIMKDEGLLPK